MPGCRKDEFLRVVRNLFEYANGSGINGEGEVREDARKICFCSSLDIPSLNLAYLKARPDKDDLLSIELFFRERGNPYTIWIPENGFSSSPELVDLGLNHTMSLPAMVADLREMKANPRPPAGYRLKSVNDESDMIAFANAAFNGFELPDDIYEKFSSFIWHMDPSQHPCNDLIIAMKGDEPVASGLMFRGGEDIGIYWISVVPDQRYRGLGAWLAQELMWHGKDEGYRHAVLQSSPAAANLYRRLGFREVGNFQVYSH